MNKKFLTTDEIHQFYGVAEDVVNELVTAGDLKALPDRGVMKYRREDLEALIKSGKLHPTKELPEGGEDVLDSDLDFPIPTGGHEQVDFLELDDAALAQAPAAADSDVPVQKPKQGTSSSDVVVLEPGPATGSDSDIHLRSDSPKPSLGEADRDATIIASDHVLEDNDDDEGITLLSADSGITLEKPDSGITLADADSGITLDSDSGLTLQSPQPSARQTAATEAIDVVQDETDVFRFADEEEPVPVLKQTPAEEETPGLFDEPDPTAVIGLDSEHQASTFSGAVASGQAVEDLEVTDHLDDMLSDEDVESAEGEEGEVVEASDDVFGEEGEVAEEGEGDEYLATAPGKAKTAGPTWGMLVNLSVIAASVVVALNAWLIFEGLNTMWSGAAPSGLASSLISSLAGLF